MDYDRTEVFDKEDCTPRYLWTQVLHIYSALVAKAGLGDRHIGAVGDKASIATFDDPQTMYRSIGFGCQFRIEIRGFARVRGGDLFRKLLERFPCLID